MDHAEPATTSDSNRVRPSRARTLTLLIGTTAFVVVIVAGNPYMGPPITHWIPLIGLTVTGVAGWLAVARDPSRLDSELVVAAAALVLGVTLTALGSAYPSLSWSAVWHLVIVAGTALFVWYVMARWGRRDLLVVLGSVLVLLVFVYLEQVFVLYRAWLELGMPVMTLPLRPLNVGGLALIPTWMSDYVVLIAPVIVVTLGRAGRAGRWAAAALGIASVLVVTIGGTRSIWLVAAMIGAALLVALLQRRGHGRMVIALGLTAGLLGSVTLALGLGDRIARSLDEGRSSAFASAIDEFVHAPLTGGGPGTYGEYRIAFPVDVLDHVAFPNSHDIVLSTLAEEGLVGLLALGIATVCLVVVVRRRWASAKPGSRSLLVAAYAGIAIVLAHALVDVVIDVPGIMIALFIVGGIALVADRGPDGFAHEDRRSWRRGGGATRALPIVGLALMVIAAPQVFRGELSIVRQVQADEDLSADPRVALTAALDAVALAPDSAPAWNAVALAADRSGQASEAITATRHLVALEALAQHHVELAILLDRAGQASDAVREIRVAAMDRRDPFVQLNAAVMLARRDLPAQAADSIRQLIVLEPFAGLQRDQLPSDVQTLWGGAAARAIGQLEAAGRWDDALAAALTGSPKLVPDVVEASPGARRALLASIATAWAGATALETPIERAAVADPSDRSLLRWAWLLAAHACDKAQADLWGTIYSIEAGPEPAVPVNLGLAPDRAQSMRPLLYPQAIWGYELPTAPYVAGTWTYALGRPDCAR